MTKRIATLADGFGCPQCNKRFKIANSAYRHLRTKHDASSTESGTSSTISSVSSLSNLATPTGDAPPANASATARLLEELVERVAKVEELVHRLAPARPSIANFGEEVDSPCTPELLRRLIEEHPLDQAFVRLVGIVHRNARRPHNINVKVQSKKEQLFAVLQRGAFTIYKLDDLTKMFYQKYGNWLEKAVYDSGWDEEKQSAKLTWINNMMSEKHETVVALGAALAKLFRVAPVAYD